MTHNCVAICCKANIEFETIAPMLESKIECGQSIFANAIAASADASMSQ